MLWKLCSRFCLFSWAKHLVPDEEKVGPYNCRFDEINVRAKVIDTESFEAERTEETGKLKFPGGSSPSRKILIGIIRLRRIISARTIEGLMAGPGIRSLGSFHGSSLYYEALLRIRLP